MHAVYEEGLTPAAGDRLVITGDEARHALRVKRLAPGDGILLLNGAGGSWLGRVEEARSSLALRIERALESTPVAPAVHVLSPAPKGPRASDLVDLLSQAGAKSWTPLVSERAGMGVSASKQGRLDRVAQAACKQCLRAWKLELRPPMSFADALACAKGEPIVLADREAPAFAPTGANCVRLLIGPEGGWSEQERESAERAGARAASFGPHVLRVEAAAAIAVAVILYAERSQRVRSSG